MRISALAIPVLAAFIGISAANTTEAAPLPANPTPHGVQTPIIAAGYDGFDCNCNCCGQDYYRPRRYYRPYRRDYDRGCCDYNQYDSGYNRNYYYERGNYR